MPLKAYQASLQSFTYGTLPTGGDKKKKKTIQHCKLSPVHVNLLANHRKAGNSDDHFQRVLAKIIEY